VGRSHQSVGEKRRGAGMVGNPARLKTVQKPLFA
jgi:hypothetical protein